MWQCFPVVFLDYTLYVLPLKDVGVHCHAATRLVSANLSGAILKFLGAIISLKNAHKIFSHSCTNRDSITNENAHNIIVCHDDHLFLFCLLTTKFWRMWRHSYTPLCKLLLWFWFIVSYPCFIDHCNCLEKWFSLISYWFNSSVATATHHFRSSLSRCSTQCKQTFPLFKSLVKGMAIVTLKDEDEVEARK